MIRLTAAAAAGVLTAAVGADAATCVLPLGASGTAAVATHGGN